MAILLNLNLVMSSSVTSSDIDLKLLDLPQFRHTYQHSEHALMLVIQAYC